VIENDLQVLGALLARLQRERARLIGHQAHRLDGAAALLVDRGVVLTHQAQQHRQVGLGAAAAQVHLVQLRAQVGMQLRVRLAERTRIRPHQRGGGACGRFRRGGPKGLRL
jgi:hypothetical protein